MGNQASHIIDVHILHAILQVLLAEGHQTGWQATDARQAPLKMSLRTGSALLWT
jgi:hypothetical protein